MAALAQHRRLGDQHPLVWRSMRVVATGAVVADGRIFISSTVLDGDYMLRFACLAFRTHLRTVDTLLKILKGSVDALGGYKRSTFS